MSRSSDIVRKQPAESEQVEQASTDSTVCVVGLGYVGLPLAVEFDKEGFDVIGFDINPEKVETLENGVDPTEDIGEKTIYQSEIEFTTEQNSIERSDYVMIAVPTPIDELKKPDLNYVESAGTMIGEQINRGTTVILESTVYPGATREILAPAIEDSSGLVAGEDFFFGYSPERMVPGDDEHGLRNVKKIVSGQNEEVADDIAELYDSVIDAGVHRAPEIEVAEAAKCIENTQRDINIALMNELAIACRNLGLNTQDVLEAAGTKWNFHDYEPGLVGGHCIPVDPFYIIYESERNGYTPKLIEKSREVNEHMPDHVAEMTLKGLNDCGKVLCESTVLVLGLTYKPNVADVRTSIINDTIEKLREYGVDVVGHDPNVSEELIQDEFSIPSKSEVSFEDIDGVIVGAAHDEYQSLTPEEMSREMLDEPLLVDPTGAFRSEAADADILYKTL